jgi:hypothetical protein
LGQFLSPLLLLPFLELFTQSQLFYVLAAILLGLSVFFTGTHFLKPGSKPSGSGS